MTSNYRPDLTEFGVVIPPEAGQPVDATWGGQRNRMVSLGAARRGDVVFFSVPEHMNDRETLEQVRDAVSEVCQETGVRVVFVRDDIRPLGMRRRFVAHRGPTPRWVAFKRSLPNG